MLQGHAYQILCTLQNLWWVMRFNILLYMAFENSYKFDCTVIWIQCMKYGIWLLNSKELGVIFVEFSIAWFSAREYLEDYIISIEHFYCFYFTLLHYYYNLHGRIIVSVIKLILPAFHLNTHKPPNTACNTAKLLSVVLTVRNLAINRLHYKFSRYALLTLHIP